MTDKWVLQSWTRFQCWYKFSGCAPKAASPTIGDVKAFNKQTGKTTQDASSETSILAPHRIIENNWISWWLLQKQWRWVFTERGMTVSSAELREHSSKDWISYGSIVMYESQRLREQYSQQPWQHCIHSCNVSFHASSSVDCGWTCQVRLHKFT